jgi:hypothetical protein
MRLNTLFMTAILGSTVAAFIQAGCGDDETTTPSTTTTTSGTGATGGGGSTGNCQAGIDNPCEMCAAANCTTEAQACADASTCTATGEATDGCLALVNCAAEKCGGGDIACVTMMCSNELSGCSGDCLSTAQALGDCVTAECAADCSQGGAGGAGGGTGGGGTGGA